MIFSGYRKWHYETANVFYLSHKRDDSLYKQQKALVKSVNPEVMKELGIEVMYKEKSSDLYGMTKIEDGVSYSFSPHAEEGSVTVYLIRVQEKKDLCSFWFEKNLDEVSVTETDVSESQTLHYKKKAIRIYKKIF